MATAPVDSLAPPIVSHASGTTIEPSSNGLIVQDDISAEDLSKQNNNAGIVAAAAPSQPVQTSSKPSSLSQDLALSEMPQVFDRATRRDSERTSMSTRTTNSTEKQANKIHNLDDELGPWRFSDPKVEPLEDTAFIFGDTTYSVKERRKYFAKSLENRKHFEFDTDIVYCMSFFLPYMNFNNFELKLGPLGANLHKYVNDQPVRYMARCASRPEEVFFMIEFSLE